MGDILSRKFLKFKRYIKNLFVKEDYHIEDQRTYNRDRHPIVDMENNPWAPVQGLEKDGSYLANERRRMKYIEELDNRQINKKEDENWS